jgi:hypothetical protein
MSANLAYPLQQPSSAGTEYQAFKFFVNAILAHVRTVHPVEVVAVHGGGVGPIGTVDVQPLVSQINGIGQGQPHKVVYGRPYIRWQGGTSAIILDPAVGDVGLLLCCDRDISNVVATLAAALPASLRRFNFADGIYLGCFLSSAAPTQYIQFGSSIAMETPEVDASDNLSVGNGASGTFTTGTGQTVDVIDGIIANIY